MKYTIFIISIIGVLPILYFTRLHFEYNVPENGFDVLLFRIWYHPLCLASAYQFTRWLKLPIRCSRGVFIGFIFIYIACFTLNIPDKIDFQRLKKKYYDRALEIEKKKMGTWNEMTDATIVMNVYITQYPKRIPLIADNKAVVYGSYQNVQRLYGRKPQSKLVHMYGNWYFWYYENNEMPG
jgi:hypothetical protein